MDGFEFIRKMHAEWPKVPIIVISVIDSPTSRSSRSPMVRKPRFRSRLIGGLVELVPASHHPPGSIGLI